MQIAPTPLSFTGDGFKDLAMYDEDGNGWIDENDEIFSKLLIWSKDENGNDEFLPSAVTTVPIVEKEVCSASAKYWAVVRDVCTIINWESLDGIWLSIRDDSLSLKRQRV